MGKRMKEIIIKTGLASSVILMFAGLPVNTVCANEVEINNVISEENAEQTGSYLSADDSDTENAETKEDAERPSLEPEEKKGIWKIDTVGWWYEYEDGIYPISSWREINGVDYWFDARGYMAVGWRYLDDVWYYFDAGGNKHTGWLWNGSYWYYLDADGVMQTGMHEINGNTYYLCSSGAMVTGWQYLDEEWYYFNASGAEHKGWLYLYDKWYFLNEEGIMLRGEQDIDGVHYFLEESGEIRNGWKYLEDAWYYFAGAGVKQTGWQWIKGYWYYLNEDGVMHTGWILLNGKWYYFRESGAMVTGSYVIDGATHSFNGSGEWLQDITAMLETVKSYEGTPYRYGGSSPYGWDCSGFVQWIMGNVFGISLPRTASEQSWCGTGINVNDKSAWQPGDLLFYVRNGSVGHVAIYLGNGMIIHALNTRKGTCIENADRYDYYDKENDLAYVRRVF